MEYLIGGTRMNFSIPAYVILALGSFFTIFSIYRVKSSPRLKCLLATAVLFSYLLIRGLFSPNDYLARSDCYTILGCLMVYLLTGYYLYQTRPRMIFVFFLLGLALVNVWVGVFQFTCPKDNFMLQGIVRDKDEIRASGLFICPNHFAGYLEAVAVMGLSLVWWSRLKVGWKLVILYAAGCCYVGIALSGSRGGYFSSVAALLMFLALSLNGVRIIDREKFIRLAFIMSLVLGMGLAGTLYLMGNSPFLQSRLNSMVVKDVRIYNWLATLDQFQTSPWVGTGAGTHLYFGRLFRRPEIQTDPMHSHGDYLELLAEYGVIGELGMLIFIWIHIRNGAGAYSWLLRKRLMNSYIPRSDTLALNIGAMSAITGLAVHSVVDFNMHIPGNALVFAFIFGLIANPGIENTDSPVASKISGLFRFALPLIGIWMGFIGVSKWPTEYFVAQSHWALRNWHCTEAIEAAKIGAGEVPANAGWPENTIRLIGADKRNSNLYFNLGEAHRVACVGLKDPDVRRDHLNQAVEAFSKADQLFPQDERILVRLGQALDALKRYDEAEVIYQRVMAVDPKLGLVYGYYGTHLFAMGKFDESKAAYEKGEALGGEFIRDLGRVDLGL